VLAKSKEGDMMNYLVLARQFLNSLFQFKKHGHRKKISENMQGEALAILFILKHTNVVSPSEMSIEMNISSARVAAMLNSLEGKELIKRQIDKTDRRKILVSLTEKGQKLAKEHNEKFESHTARMLELLGEHDAKELVRITEKLVTLTSNVKEDK
jgi:DNA-binding MarR family transcriptional regulator